MAIDRFILSMLHITNDRKQCTIMHVREGDVDETLLCAANFVDV